MSAAAIRPESERLSPGASAGDAIASVNPNNTKTITTAPTNLGGDFRGLAVAAKRAQAIRPGSHLMQTA
jgi:hypothetical protein